MEIVCDSLLKKYNEIPILSETYSLLQDMFEKDEYEQDFQKLSSLILTDPFFTLKILIRLSFRQKNNLSLEIDSIKKSIMMLGSKEIMDLALSSSVAMNHEGLTVAIKRAQYASKIAVKLSVLRYDILPEEIQLATLLADLGELILWIFNPELPLKVRESMIKKEYQRNKDAQMAICDFKFKDISVFLATGWHLPEPIIQLIGNTSNNVHRSEITRVSIDLARHVYAHDGFLAIPSDIYNIEKIMPKNSRQKILDILSLNKVMNKDQVEYILNNISMFHNDNIDKTILDEHN